MARSGVNPSLLHAWLSARSLARGLPAPAADRGGYRVDTGSEDEVARWVFPTLCAGLVELGGTIDRPRHLLKLCGSDSELRSALPQRWRSDALRHFMVGPDRTTEELAEGYTMEMELNGSVIEARAVAGNGEEVGRGTAVDTPRAFVYDRILIALGHRRKGLGKAIMGALRQRKRSRATPDLLVATEEGRALYESLGWRTLSPYSTASIPASPSPRGREPGRGVDRGTVFPRLRG